MPESKFKCEKCGKKLTYVEPIGRKPTTEQFCGDCGSKMKLLSMSQSNEVKVGRPVIINPDFYDKKETLEFSESTTELPFVFQKEKKLISFGEEISETEYIVNFEESRELGENYVVMVNGAGKKRYFKKGKEYELGTELIPLNKEELRDLAIEESANDGFFKEIYQVGETLNATD